MAEDLVHVSRHICLARLLIARLLLFPRYGHGRRRGSRLGPPGSAIQEKLFDLSLEFNAIHGGPFRTNDFHLGRLRLSSLDYDVTTADAAYDGHDLRQDPKADEEKGQEPFQPIDSGGDQHGEHHHSKHTEEEAGRHGRRRLSIVENPGW